MFAACAKDDDEVEKKKRPVKDKKKKKKDNETKQYHRKLSPATQQHTIDRTRNAPIRSFVHMCLSKSVCVQRDRINDHRITSSAESNGAERNQRSTFQTYHHSFNHKHRRLVDFIARVWNNYNQNPKSLSFSFKHQLFTGSIILRPHFCVQSIDGSHPEWILNVKCKTIVCVCVWCA